MEVQNLALQCEKCDIPHEAELKNFILEELKLKKQHPYGYARHYQLRDELEKAIDGHPIFVHLSLLNKLDPREAGWLSIIRDVFGRDGLTIIKRSEMELELVVY